MDNQENVSNYEQLRPGDVIDLAGPANNGLLGGRVVRYGGAASAIDIAPGIEVYVADLVRAGWAIVDGRRTVSPRELAIKRVAAELREGVLSIPAEFSGADRGQAILDLAPRIVMALIHDGWRMMPGRAVVDRALVALPLELSEPERTRVVDVIMKLVEGEEG